MRTVYSSRYRTLLERLKAARRAASLSQAEVAKAFGRPQSFVSKCESGERRIDVLELDRFATGLSSPDRRRHGGAAAPGGPMD